MINNLKRNPLLIEYTTGLKTLDCIYLDTSNNDPDLPFPEQHAGLAELIAKVKQYPKDTVFHFAAWTYGYEKVWLALAHALQTKIHVDKYKLRIFNSLVATSNNDKSALTSYHQHEAAALAGYHCGNAKQEGCLTDDSNIARIHSCEKGTKCSIINNNPNVVWITPIVARLPDGTEIAEIGVGGGGGDLKQHAELELCSEADVDTFLEMMDFGFSWTVRDEFRHKLLSAVQSSRMTISLDDLGLFELEHDQNEMSLETLAALITKSTKPQYEGDSQGTAPSILPKRITFPYSRHSSFEECVALVEAFKPKDVYPCTVDEENWHEGVGVRLAFGKCCTEKTFRHDHEMRQLLVFQREDNNDQQTHTTDSDRSNDSDKESSPVPEEQVFKKPALSMIESSSSRDNSGSSRVTSDVHSYPQAPPPSQIVAISPGSQSQNLRRTLIMAGLADNIEANKRARVDHIDMVTSATESHGSIPRLNYHIAQYKPHGQALSSVAADDHFPSFSSGPDTPASSACNEAQPEVLNQEEENVIYCNVCGMECWHKDKCDNPTCEGREDGYPGPSYFEIFEDGEVVFDLVENENTDTIMNSEARREELDADQYLDVDSEAYDTMDEEEHEPEEYEINSMIDDGSENDSIDSNNGDAANSGDEETFWESKYNELKLRFEALEAKHAREKEAHKFTLTERDTARKQLVDLLLRDEENYDEEDSDDIDEDGRHLINPKTQHPSVTEVILSHATEESQSSATSDRIQDRIEAGVDASHGWQNVSIVSAGFNHTEEEIEL